MPRQLNLDRDKLDQCYYLASLVVSQASKYIDRHSTVSIEGATLLAMGLQGEWKGRLLAIGVAESLTKDQLRLGAAYWWGRALLATKEEPLSLAEKLIRKKIKWESLPEVAPAEIRKETKRLISNTLEGWKKSRASISPFKIKFSSGLPFSGLRLTESKPARFFSSTKDVPPDGNSLRVVSVIKEGFKKEESILAPEGLNIPEQILASLPLGVQAFEVDGWSPVFQKSIALERALTDFYFSLLFSSQWNVYFLSRHAFLTSKPDQLFAMLLLYEQMAKRADFSLDKLIFSFSFPSEGISFTDKVAAAQMLREIFSQSFLWCRLSSATDPFSIWAATFAEIDVVEGPKQPSLQEMEGIQNEFSLNTYGKVSRQAHQWLDQTWRLLKKMSDVGLWKSLDQNILFSSAPDAAGKEGVFQKSYHYWNPLMDMIKL